MYAAAGQSQRYESVRERLLPQAAAGESTYDSLRYIVLYPLAQGHVSTVDEILSRPGVNPHGTRAGVLYRLGRYQEALDAIEETTQYFEEYRFVRALAQFGLGNVTEARAALARANEQFQDDIAEAGGGWKPSFGMAEDWARVLVWQREAKRVIVEQPLADVTKALATDPENAELLSERADIFIYTGRLDEASADLNRLLEIDPRDAENLARRGDLRAIQGNWDAAATDYVAAAQAAPDDAGILDRLDRLVREAWLTPLAPDAERKAISWRYTTTRPANDYANADFDDSEWKSGDAPFATTATETPNADTGRTLWDAKDTEVWLRREFHLDALPQGTLLIRFRCDDDASVRINGVRATSLFFAGEYDLKGISAEAMAAVAPGRNVLTVHAKNVVGTGMCDVGLYVSPGPERVLDVLNAIVDAHPDAIASRRKRAELLVLLGRYDEAAGDIATILEAGEWNPDKPWFPSERASKVVDAVVASDRLFTAVTKLRPDDAALWITRARFLGHWSHWNSTAAATREAIRLDERDHRAHQVLAAVLAEIGDEQAYRDLCAQILARFADADSPMEVDAAAKSCLLLPDAVDDMAAVRALAKRQLDLALAEAVDNQGTKNLLPWFYFCHGLAEYRAGDDDRAAVALVKAIDDPAAWNVCRSTSQIVLAMVRHRQGQTDEARRLLVAADAERAEWNSGRAANDLGEGWWDPLTLKILRREADRAISAANADPQPPREED